MKTTLGASVPLPLHGASRDNYSLSDWNISMKNAYSWDWKQLIKRLTLPHSCLCLQKGMLATTAAASGRFVFPAVLFGCFQHRGDPPLAWCFVFPKLTFNQETSQLLFVLCSVHHLLSSRLSEDLKRKNCVYTAYSYFILSSLGFIHTIKHWRLMQTNMLNTFQASQFCYL